MPQQYWYPQNYTSTATTTNYIPIYNQQWYTTSGTSLQTQVVSPNTIWQNWNTTTGYTPAYDTYSNQVWIQWNQEPYQPRVWTPEEQERQRQITEERYQARAAARARARTLLGEFLDDEQKAELEHHGQFHVTGSRGRRYCIRAEGQSGNVDLLKPDGSVQARLCCHPRSMDYESLPEGDAWLMQMIEIRHDEDHFLRTANVHRGSLAGIR
jgi:hypothetical protein